MQKKPLDTNKLIWEKKLKLLPHQKSVGVIRFFSFVVLISQQSSSDKRFLVKQHATMLRRQRHNHRALK